MIRHIVTASLIALGALAITAHAEESQGGRYTPEQKKPGATPTRKSARPSSARPRTGKRSATPTRRNAKR